MIRDFGSFTRRGLLADLEHPAEIWWGHIADRAGENDQQLKEMGMLFFVFRIVFRRHIVFRNYFLTLALVIL